MPATGDRAVESAAMGHGWTCAVRGGRELPIDRAVYLVDDAARTYGYLRRNPAWKDLDPEENQGNKRHLDGYTRIFPDGRTKVYSYRAPSTTRAHRPINSPRTTRAQPGP